MNTNCTDEIYEPKLVSRLRFFCSHLHCPIDSFSIGSIWEKKISN